MLSDKQVMVLMLFFLGRTDPDGSFRQKFMSFSSGGHLQLSSSHRSASKGCVLAVVDLCHGLKSDRCHQDFRFRRRGRIKSVPPPAARFSGCTASICTPRLICLYLGCVARFNDTTESRCFACEDGQRGSGRRLRV